MELLNYPTEDEHCWCGEHRVCPNPEPAYCGERIERETRGTPTPDRDW